MKKNKAHARWEGILKDGTGEIKLDSGKCDSLYSYSSRFESSQGTNPEELIGGAHAGCFSMALANELNEEGFLPKEINTDTNVTLDKVDGSYKITKIELSTVADVSEIDKDKFAAIANRAKQNCPVSKALAGTEIVLTSAKLK